MLVSSDWGTSFYLLEKNELKLTENDNIIWLTLGNFSRVACSRASKRAVKMSFKFFSIVIIVYAKSLDYVLSPEGMIDRNWRGMVFWYHMVFSDRNFENWIYFWSFLIGFAPWIHPECNLFYQKYMKLQIYKIYILKIPRRLNEISPRRFKQARFV